MGDEAGCVESTGGEDGESTGGEAGGKEPAGGASTGDEGGGDVEDAKDETTSTCSFMPEVQWPGMPHMKYLVPGCVSWIVVLPP